MAKSDKTVKRGVYLYIDGKEIKNDINSIDLEMKRLQRDIKEMTRGSEEYNRTMAKIQHLQGILKQHRQEIKGITTETKKATVSIGSMVDWFNRFGGVILSVMVSLPVLPLPCAPSETNATSWRSPRPG